MKSKRELVFEKLGGTHLLLHRIWAFKIDAAGERTDLVLAERIAQDNILYQSVDGLVLTEWKRVENQSDLESRIQAAKTQAKKYSQSSLVNIELSNHRYLVMVSEDYLDIPNDEMVDGNITYRVINIAYKPSTPSKFTNKLK